MVAGKNVGYVFRQTARGMRIEPRATKADLPRGTKLFKPGTRSEAFALIGTVKTEADLPEAVAVLTTAATKLTEAKKAPAKKASTSGAVRYRPEQLADWLDARTVGADADNRGSPDLPDAHPPEGEASAAAHGAVGRGSSRQTFPLDDQGENDHTR